MSREGSNEVRRRALTYGTLFFLGASALLESTACAVGGGSSPPTCISPATVSKLYEGDPAATNDRATWHFGVLATSRNLPRDASYIGLIVGFRPNDHTPWRLSNPITRQDDADKTLQLEEGNGPVQFETLVEAKAGSSDCQHAPSTVFNDPQPLNQLSGTHPTWP